jgi:5-methylcytosine-specific restriction endonuclease McrA
MSEHIEFLRRHPGAILKPVPTGPKPHSNAKRRREELLKQQRGKCAYCQRRMVKKRGQLNSVTLEHRKPLSRGGNHSRKNLLATCAMCNRLKGGMTEEKFLALLEKIAFHDKATP